MARKKQPFNIRRIAEEAGVSLASVSRVLNNHADISESLRRKVLAAIEANNLVPDKAVERPLRISVIFDVGDITDFISSILTGMGDAANDLGIELSIQRCVGNVSLLRACRNWRCDGVAIICGKTLNHELPSLAAAHLPCMLIDNYYDGPMCGYIGNASYDCTRQIMQYLDSIGHRRIAYLCGEPPNDDYDERLRAYNGFMESIGQADPALRIPSELNLFMDSIGRDKERGYQQAKRVISQLPDVTAMVCANDEIAMGCYRGCFDMGRRVGQDLSVVGYDDQSFARHLAPGLTTIHIPLTDIGRRIIRVLHDYLHGTIKELPREIITGELVVRGSTGSPCPEAMKLEGVASE